MDKFDDEATREWAFSEDSFQNPPSGAFGTEHRQTRDRPTRDPNQAELDVLRQTVRDQGNKIGALQVLIDKYRDEVIRLQNRAQRHSYRLRVIFQKMQIPMDATLQEDEIEFDLSDLTAEGEKI